MNEGFLMFSPDEGVLTSEWHSKLSLVLKEEQEDLTHLAPTAGDACISLENSPFDMFDDFILSANYDSLLVDDLANGSPVDSLTADSLLLSSPEPQETESSCERSSLLTEISLDGFDGTRSEKEVETKSPFVPEMDEVPLLEPEVMWGALPDNVSLARPQPSEVQNASPAPALQRLLAAPPTGPPPQDLITNIYSDQGLIPNRSISSWDTGVKRTLKQEEEPSAKRVKRSSSPAPTKSSSPSSSVLMNLLDLPQPTPPTPKYQVFVNQPKMVQLSPNRNVIPIPVMNLLQMSNKQALRVNTPINSPMYSSPMSPLSLNVSSPMYSLPSSPAMSPAQKDRVLSPYSSHSLSPAGSYTFSPNNNLLSPVMQNDPYLTNKMQPSPSFQIQTDFMDTGMSLGSDFWTETDVLQGANDLLTALDDVKLG